MPYDPRAESSPSIRPFRTVSSLTKILSLQTPEVKDLLGALPSKSSYSEMQTYIERALPDCTHLSYFAKCDIANEWEIDCAYLDALLAEDPY